MCAVYIRMYILCRLPAYSTRAAVLIVDFLQVRRRNYAPAMLQLGCAYSPILLLPPLLRPCGAAVALSLRREALALDRSREDAEALWSMGWDE